MNIYVIDGNFDIVDVIDEYTSLIWTTRYYKSGDFEIYTAATSKHISLMKRGYFLCREDDMDDDVMHNVMVINNVQIITDVENGNYIVVTGKCLKSIVGRRIVWEQTILSGYTEVAIRTVINENIINPTIASRKIANFIFAPLKNFTERIDTQVTGDNIETWLEEVCKTCGIGWDVYIDNGKFVFTLWKGEDRSYSQDINPHVVFSQEFDNLLTSDYKMDSDNYKNVALVAGEGEGTERKTYAVGNATDLDRYEIYVDAGSISTNEGEVSEAMYNAILSEKGLETLAEHGTTETFDGEIEPNTTYIINQDYFLGDIIQIINEHGIESRSRIVEVIDSEDENGRVVIPTYEAEVI